METLKKVLLVNALSSAACGLLLAVMPSKMAELFEVSQAWPFIATGIFLIVFADLVLYAFFRKKPSRGLLQSIVYTDISWVTLSILVVALSLFDLSALGYVLISGVALWVALMAYLQNAGLKKIKLAN